MEEQTIKLLVQVQTTDGELTKHTYRPAGDESEEDAAFINSVMDKIKFLYDPSMGAIALDYPIVIYNKSHILRIHIAVEGAPAGPAASVETAVARLSIPR